MGAVFWIAIVFTVMCIAGGYMIAKLGPDLFPTRPAAKAQPELAAQVEALTRRVERLEADQRRCGQANPQRACRTEAPKAAAAPAHPR